MSVTPSPPAREIARQLVAQHLTGTNNPSDAGQALQRLCTSVSDSLRSSVGDDGREALLSRVLAGAEAAHPVLCDVRGLGSVPGASLDGVRESVEAYGIDSVTTGIEFMLASLIDLLGAFIGQDMVLNLLNIDRPTPYEPRQSE
jgi:hypothetical protein